jgi:hypothetical protein
MWVLTLFSIPTFVAGVLMYFLGNNAHRTIRKSFIALLYAIPWNWGTSFGWHKQTSQRETFFILWFAAFVFTLIVLLWRT